MIAILERILKVEECTSPVPCCSCLLRQAKQKIDLVIESLTILQGVQPFLISPGFLARWQDIGQVMHAFPMFRTSPQSLFPVVRGLFKISTLKPILAQQEECIRIFRIEFHNFLKTLD